VQVEQEEEKRGNSKGGATNEKGPGKKANKGEGGCNGKSLDKEGGKI